MQLQSYAEYAHIWVKLENKQKKKNLTWEDFLLYGLKSKFLFLIGTSLN